MKRQPTNRVMIRLSAFCGAFVLLLVPMSVTSSGISANEACGTGDDETTCATETNSTCIAGGELIQHRRTNS